MSPLPHEPRQTQTERIKAIVGNDPNWMFAHNAALDHARHGFRAARRNMTWVLRRRHFREVHAVSFDVAELLFCMGASIETFCFSLHVIGYAVGASGFEEVMDRPWSVKLGHAKEDRFRRAFPRCAALLSSAWRDTVEVIIDNSDIGKHRYHTLTGGDDVRPDGDEHLRFGKPRIMRDPKGKGDAGEGFVLVNDLFDRFVVLIPALEAAAVEDIEALVLRLEESPP